MKRYENQILMEELFKMDVQWKFVKLDKKYKNPTDTLLSTRWRISILDDNFFADPELNFRSIRKESYETDIAEKYAKIIEYKFYLSKRQKGIVMTPSILAPSKWRIQHIDHRFVYCSVGSIILYCCESNLMNMIVSDSDNPNEGKLHSISVCIESDIGNIPEDSNNLSCILLLFK